MKKYKKFITNEYEIISDKLPSTFDNTRIVMLSDFHNNSYGVDAEGVLEAVKCHKPDFVIVGGDMYTGTPGIDNLKARDFMVKLAADHKVFYGLGNHEYRMMIHPEVYPGMYDEFMDMVGMAGVTLLRNETVPLRRDSDEILITGLMIDACYYKKFRSCTMPPEYMESIAGKCRAEKFNILIAHNPVYFYNYVQWGADLVFAGHMHGGMARLPYIGGVIAPSYAPFPRFDMGLYTKDNTSMVLSAGIGTHTINLRPFNPPEIVVLKLACKK